jgi:serine/threonine protein kinase, bacterial
MPLTPGQTFAGYTILRPLGTGGMGEVYLAEHPRLPRHEAIKILRRDVSADDEYRARFNREADMVAGLYHPNIVGIHDRGEADGQLWISMDFVEGTDAGQLLQGRYRNGMPPDDVVRVVTEVADALDYAHQRLLLHRDVKPANILLTDLGSVRLRALLADFGIARRIDDATRLTSTSMTVGTVAYAAPEQLMGTKVDGRADQYALAATAFHLLTGSHLFQDANPAVVISKHLTSPPPAIANSRPELSGLGPVLAKALAKSPDDRYDTCGDFAAALRTGIGTIAEELGVYDATQQAPVSGHRATVAPGSGQRVAVAVLAAAAVLGAAIGAYFVVERPDHPPAAAARGAPVPQAAPNSPVVPVVLVGADCATLGAAGQTSTGQTAYCARLPSTGDIMWSLYSGQVPDPTVVPASGDPTYDTGIEQQVRVCTQETGQDRLTCREEIRRGNLVGPP